MLTGKEPKRMRVLYQVQSRECERAEWRPWALTVPFSCRADCEAQVELLNSREPYPTRPWMARREFRMVEVPAGCPKCFVQAIGPDCQYHTIMAALGAKVAPPSPMPAPAKMRPSPRVRRSPGVGYSAESIAILRSHAQSEAIGARVPTKQEGAE